MTQQEFQACIDKCQYKIEEIKEHAHMLHDSVNQRYDMNHPYSYHLDMVADLVFKYGHLVCQQEGDVLPLFFGAFYHDSIEDARMTYNDVTKGARLFMSDDQAYMAAEMVYALTNEKGRTRADRLANITYSCSKENGLNGRMRVVYKDELPHFLEAINAHSDDPRFALPQVMIDQIYQLL